MKYWYQKPDDAFKDQIKTVLILEGFTSNAPSQLPLVTTGMPVFFCKMEISETGSPLFRFSLFGTSAPRDCWMINETTTIIAFFFNPFMMATLFNVDAATLKERPVELHEWNAHATN